MFQKSVAAGLRSALAVCAAGLALHSGALQATSTLTIFHNNDGESDVLPDGDVAGIGGFVGTLAALRSVNTSDAMLTLSSGDNFLAGPEFNAGTAASFSYDAQAWALIGYDALAIGNHEFDLGPDTFANLIQDYKVASGFKNGPFLSANLDVSGEPMLEALRVTGDIARSTVVERAGVRYGIIGATTPNLPFISSPGNVVVDQDVAGAVQSEIDSLQLGADGMMGTADDVTRIIFISHLQGVAEDRALIAQLRGVDIAIAGGGDDLLANPGDDLLPGDMAVGPYPDLTTTDLDGNTVPIITTAGQYGYLGMLTVEFDDDGNVISIDNANSGPVRNYTPDGVMPAFPAVANIESPVQAFVDGLATNVLATTEVELSGDRDIVRAVEANLGNLIADALRAEAASRLNDFGVNDTIPLIGMVNGGGIRDDGTTGGSSDVTELDTFNVLPFGNSLSVVTDVTTQQLLDQLENAVSRVVNVGGQPVRMGSGTGRFAQVSGLTFSYDLNAQPLELDVDGNVITPGERIRQIMLSDGTVVVANGMVVEDILVNIATLSFNAAGGDQWFWSFDQTLVNLGISDQQAYAAFLVDLGVVTGAMYPVGGEGRINVIPVPAALPLLLSALAGLAVFRRRRSA